MQRKSRYDHICIMHQSDSLLLSMDPIIFKILNLGDIGSDSCTNRKACISNTATIGNCVWYELYIILEISFLMTTFLFHFIFLFNSLEKNACENNDDSCECSNNLVFNTDFSQNNPTISC